MNKENLLENNRKILQSFLELRDIPKEYKAPIIPGERSPYGFIYCIENKLNHRKYIGSTYSVWVGIANPSIYAPLRKRASGYIYEYNNALKTTSSVRRTQRSILQAMVQYGIENFVMYPIAETTRFNHSEMEIKMINKYDTILNGYNQTLIGGSSNKHGIYRAMSDAEKKARSESILAVNMNNKLLQFADSMKLFGETMGSSKDLIKNAARCGRPHKGWFIFYEDQNKRHAVLQNILDGEISYIKHARLSKDFVQFYQGLCKSVDDYLDKPIKSEIFYDFKLLPDISFKSE